jgi:Ca2+-transporting ATPase
MTSKYTAPQAAHKPIASWHALSIDQVLRQLDAELHSGLTDAEAAKRQAHYGLNQLTEAKRPSFLSMLLDQLKSFVVIMLIVAALVSSFLGEWVDAVAIMTIVILNAVLGVVQERRAEEALAALKKLAAPEAIVLRSGHRISIPARELVPGDIVFLETGNYIPADLRLVETINLQIDESALTGESMAVQKNATLTLDKDIPLGDWRNTAFAGSVVTYGRGEGVVVSTGMHTQLGLIATMLQAVEDEETPLQKRLDQLGKTLGWGALAICAAVFLIGWLEGGKLLTMFLTAVSLAIAAVPEGLPAIVTISLALGMKEMIKRHALIRRLSSVETLGSATVICSDKTGTLTQNAMTVTRLWVGGEFVEVTGSGYRPVGTFQVRGKTIHLEDHPAIQTALWVGTMNNDARLEEMTEGDEPTYRITGDPTEAALIVAAVKAGTTADDIMQAFPRVREIPFDSERKRMVTVHSIEQPELVKLAPVSCEKNASMHVVAIKGAPDIVLDLCSQWQAMNEKNPQLLDQRQKEKILLANDDLTQDALRVLGVAYKVIPEDPATLSPEELEKDFIFSGLVGMMDPAREEVKVALVKAKGAGIRTIMITGDYPNTAKAVAESIGLLQPGHKVLTGAQLNAFDDEQLKQEVRHTDVFARVSPEHKMRIVDALKANGEIVAMTGDGVNDAPAIKRSDIGVAMGITGTDVAKETADMVLTDDNYASIVSAVEQGRIIYSNIRKFVYFLVSCNLAEILVVFLPIAFGRWLFPETAGREILAPLAAIQILLMNLVTDGAPALALGTEKGDPDTMVQPPRPPKEPIINRRMWVNVLIQTLTFTVVTLVAYGVGLAHVEHQYAETMAFVTISLAQVLRAFSSRSERYPILKIGLFSNKWMNMAALSSIVIILLAVYVPFLNIPLDTLPMTLGQWVWVLPLALVPSLVGEVSKAIIYRKTGT